jgi:hypothetical protein
MFDLRLARFCGELYASGRASRIVFTGGIGPGTADLGQPEADAWYAELLRSQPNIPHDRVIVENQSTNTSENVRFTAELLARRHPSLSFGHGIKTVIIVASPSRMRRVRLTLLCLQPGLRILRQRPPSSFDDEHALYAGKGIDYLAHLAGELDRIVDYAARGWIIAEPLPLPISQAHETLKRAKEPLKPSDHRGIQTIM